MNRFIFISFTIAGLFETNLPNGGWNSNCEKGAMVSLGVWTRQACAWSTSLDFRLASEAITRDVKPDNNRQMGRCLEDRICKCIVPVNKLPLKRDVVASLFRNGYIVRTEFKNGTRKETRFMREGIHPDYKKSIVTCVCGNTFTTRSTIGDLKIEICSSCHPFFTGRQKLVDSAGRVERYNKKYAKKPATTPAA